MGSRPPEILWHGTGKKYEESIDAQGLIPKSRLYVHLSGDIETAKKVGVRHGKLLLYRVKTGQMQRDGYTFYRSVNGVWLTKAVPAEYLEKVKDMRILMLGNSFTFVNNMPQMLAELTGAEVVHHTRGGARLAEQLNPETVNGGLTQAALQNEKWDYVVLQEMSNGPITSKNSFLKNVSLLCERIRENGAKPILYATWAYQRDGKALASFGMDYDEMYRKMYASCHEAAEQNDALIADVGEKFYDLADTQELFADDGCHPNEAGSMLAARTIAEVIRADQS